MDQKKKCVYTCSYAGCLAKYYRKDRLEIHVRSHTGERPFLCSYDDCFKSFIRATHLKRHESTHENNNIRCTYKDCNGIFKTQMTLKKHVDNIHLNKKPKLYKCSHCDQQFNKHSFLKRHEYKHTNIKPYVCSEKDCGKSFLMPSRLARHQKIHQGYRCLHEGCGVVSQMWSLHLKHKSINHPIIYECSTCSKTFRNKVTWKTHEATHLNPEDREFFPCPVPGCEKSYYERKNLQHHYYAVHVGYPLKCSHNSCSSSFKDKEQLKKHVDKVHNPNVPLSSKKKKLKAKKKKTELSFAATLAGLLEEPEPDKAETGLVSSGTTTVEADQEAKSAIGKKEIENFVASSCESSAVEERRDFMMVEISISKMNENTIYTVNEENCKKRTQLLQAK